MLFPHPTIIARPHLSYRAPKRFFDLYDESDIPLPLHRRPSPTAPAISYSHSCQVDTHTTTRDEDERVALEHMGLGIYDTVVNAEEPKPATASNLEDGPKCALEVMHRSVDEFGNNGTSLVEINLDDGSVRDLRRAYYATISFMDSQLGRVLAVMEETGLVNDTIITFIGKLLSV